MRNFDNITNLVFEGSGIKGYAYVQVLREIVQHHPSFLKNITRYAGTSAGSMMASLLCMGYSLEDIDNLLVDISHMDLFQKKRCKLYNFFTNVYSLYRQYGIYDIQPLEEFVKNTLRNKWKILTGVDEDPTFNDVFVKLGKELVLTSTNMNTNELIYFSHKLTPNTPIYKSVISSSCIPGIFKPVKYDFNPDVSEKNVYLMDGGIILNYPIFVFDHGNPYEAFSSGDFNDKTLGFLIQTTDDSLLNNHQLQKKVKGFKTFVSNTINIISNQLQKKSMKQKDWNRTIQIYVRNYSASNIVLTDDIRNELIDSARVSVTPYLV
jgi:NTE family protein